MTEFIWIAILVVAFIVEISTAALVSVWFMPGAFLALILSALSLPIWIQVASFAVVSVVMIVLSRTAFRKWLHSKPIEKTNSDALIGETAIVTEDINNIEGKGQVKVASQVWSARSADNTQNFERGSLVQIVSIEGVKLICKKID